jgi:hypothetical protein
MICKTSHKNGNARVAITSEVWNRTGRLVLLVTPRRRRRCEMISAKFAVSAYFNGENVRERKRFRSLNIGEPGTTFPPT